MYKLFFKIFVFMTQIKNALRGELRVLVGALLLQSPLPAGESALRAISLKKKDFRIGALQVDKILQKCF